MIEFIENKTLHFCRSSDATMILHSVPKECKYEFELLNCPNNEMIERDQRQMSHSEIKFILNNEKIKSDSSNYEYFEVDFKHI